MREEFEVLTKLFQSMAESDRHALMQFAHFLAADKPVAAPTSAPVVVATEPVPEPEQVPRPEEETVIAAVKRLTATYPMVDKRKLFGETSTLMSAHVMEGRAASEVIDELESVFEHAYLQLKEESLGND